jgi:hypothetical protein
MPAEFEQIPGITDDPVMRLVFSGQAKTYRDAEDFYLNQSLGEIASLAGSDMTDEELAQHPLFQMLVRNATPGWEDSLW